MMKKYLALALIAPLLVSCSSSTKKGAEYNEAWVKDTNGFDILMALVLVFMAIRVYSKVPMTEEQFQNRKRMSKKGKRIMWIVIAVAVIAIAVVFYLWAWPLLVKAFKI